MKKLQHRSLRSILFFSLIWVKYGTKKKKKKTFTHSRRRVCSVEIRALVREVTQSDSIRAERVWQVSRSGICLRFCSDLFWHIQNSPAILPPVLNIPNQTRLDVSWEAEVESSRTSLASRTPLEVLGLGLKTSSPRKLPCPRLEDSTIFEPLKFRWKTPETLQKICKDLCLVSSSRDHLKKNFFEDLFFWDRLKKVLKTFFFWRTLTSVSLVLGRVCPWPRNFFVSLAASVVSSTPPLLGSTGRVVSVVPLPVRGYFTCAAAIGIFSYHNTVGVLFCS